MQEETKTTKHAKPLEGIAAASVVLPDEGLAEMVYDSAHQHTAFIVWRGGSWNIEASLNTSAGTYLVPYSPENNLLKHEVVLFPSEPEEYESEERLIAEVQAFIHRYVDVSPLFEKIASYYVLFSWMYDNFNELPYLRLPAACAC